VICCGLVSKNNKNIYYYFKYEYIAQIFKCVLAVADQSYTLFTYIYNAFCKYIKEIFGLFVLWNIINVYTFYSNMLNYYMLFLLIYLYVNFQVRLIINYLLFFRIVWNIKMLMNIVLWILLQNYDELNMIDLICLIRGLYFMYDWNDLFIRTY
jgi:hypothetical protein